MTEVERDRLAEENNKILHKLLNAQRRATAAFVLKWLVIIALSLGAYYYLQPWLEAGRQFYQEFVSPLSLPLPR